MPQVTAGVNVTVQPDDFWVQNAADAANQAFTNQTSVTGNLVLGIGNVVTNYSEYSFDSGDYTYRYIGNWEVAVNGGLLSAATSAQGYYDQVVVEKGGQFYASVDLDAPLSVDFGSRTGIDLLGLGLTGLTNPLLSAVFGAEPTVSLDNLHLAADPDLPDEAGLIPDTTPGGDGDGDGDGDGNGSGDGGGNGDGGGDGSGDGGGDGNGSGGNGNGTNGTGGDDTTTGTQGGDVIHAQGGDDQIDGAGGDDALNGDAGNDTLHGGVGNDTLNGGADNDMLHGGSGADALDGGTGTDMATYHDSGAGVTIDLAAGTAAGGDAEGDTFANIEDVTGSAHSDKIFGDAGRNSLHGLAGDDALNGRSGDDILNGGAGDDVVNGGAGRDTMDGGAGSDTLDYQGSPAGVQINLGTGTASGGDAEGDTFFNFENIAGSAFNDRLYGDLNANVLQGFGGNDVIYGLAGTDTLSGGSGNDTLNGGSGSDALDGGSGIDTLDYRGSAAGVRIDMAAGRGAGGDAQGDTFSNFERAGGSSHNDKLLGDLHANILRGYDGNDSLNGRAGNDRLYGHGGNDTLIGDRGNDVLFGSDGRDVLYGGNGRDFLQGGADADRFVFKKMSDSLTTSSGRDTIHDFSRAQGDRIDLSVIDANSHVSGNQAFDFIGSASFHGGEGELRYQTIGRETYLYGDVNGDGKADFAVHLDGAIQLSSGDFLL